jgi:tetratricopeptide (TPR) repeat protein
VDQLAREILDGLSSGPAMRVARLAARMTGSLPALKAYLEGERCLRGGRYFDAMELLQRATREDPAFALAHYHLAAAAAGCAMPGFAREVIERAHAHRSRLTEHDRLLLDAQRAWLQGEVSNAESLYNAITASYPDDVEALGWYGSIAERSPYELVYAAPSHLRRAEIFTRQGDHEAADAESEQARTRWAKADAPLASFAPGLA